MQGKRLFYLPRQLSNGVNGNCVGCHQTEAFIGPSLSNPGPLTTFATTNGLDAISTTDLGVNETTDNPNDTGKFKVPSLKNIAIRPPYMHDGRFATLEEVIDHYSSGIQNHPNLISPLVNSNGQVGQFNFTQTEKEALIAFLNTLTDNQMLTDENIIIHLNKMKPLFFIVIIFSLLSCNDDDGMTDGPPTIESPPNILLIIADDLGKDAINGFSEGSIKPNTPNIDAIRSSGLSFTNFWSYPTCSPTRASILTGKYGYRTGVKWAGDELDLSETSLQKYINNQTDNSYSTAIAGKWHLSGSNGTFNPEIFGIDYYAGLIRGQAQSYNNWLLTENGAGNVVTEYTTEKFTDLAIDWINEQDKPWFMWLAHNAPHTPFHVPPNDMHSQGNLPEFIDGMDEMPYYMAAIEAMDFQIGRLLDNFLPEERENTIIIFIGDNGTPNEVAQLPYSNTTAKGSLYQGGINVPMFISGAGVTRTGNDDNLIASTDLFATISEIAGVSINEIHDSKSFKSLLSQSSTIRNFQYTEKDNGTTDNWTISNGSYKLIENTNGDQELYDLNNDPYEQSNLLNGTLTNNETNAKLELQDELMIIRQ